MTQRELVALELLIDKYGMQDFLYALSRICREKSEHISTYADSEELSKAWEGMSSYLHKSAGSPRIFN